jgi:hypothetical protein
MSRLRPRFLGGSIFFNGKSPGGPGSISLIISGGTTKYYKGPNKKENNT